MKAAGQLIQATRVSILRDTGHSTEPTLQAGKAEQETF
jgi:hypothetical protein